MEKAIIFMFKGSQKFIERIRKGGGVEGEGKRKERTSEWVCVCVCVRAYVCVCDGGGGFCFINYSRFF